MSNRELQSFKLKIGKCKKIVEPDQQDLFGKYVIDSHKDCQVCNGNKSWAMCDHYQNTGKCTLMQE